MKAYGVNYGRGELPNRRSIDNQLMMVEEHSLIGGWESYTIFGKGHNQAFVTLKGRESSQLLMQKVDKRIACNVCSLIKFRQSTFQIALSMHILY